MQQKRNVFKFLFSDIQIQTMIENEIYCYVNGFLKWNISKTLVPSQETNNLPERPTLCNQEIYQKHLHSTTTYFDLYNSFSKKIIDKDNSKFDLKIKEALHINWRRPYLIVHQNHVAITLSLNFCPPLLLFVFALYFFLSLSSIIFIISDTSYRHFLLS